LTELKARERIDEQAARWAARNALADGADAGEFDAWLAADRRHQGAYLRALASYYAMEEAVLANPVPTASNDDEPLAEPATSLWARLPRATLAAAMAIAACVTVVVLVRAPQTPVAPSHERAVSTLADGSSVDLGRDGAIATAIDGKWRRITLERGAATFHVAKDRSRPFIVRSGQVYAEATGTVYSVRRVGGTGGAVRVTEGTVRVWVEGERDEAVLLHAGQALTLEPTALQPTAPASPAVQSFWFDNVTIDQAAARFNRVNGTRIVVADRTIGQVTIMGSFKPERPAEFAKAAAAITGARVSERAGTLVIEKK
jgi:transmembrane sensor